MNNTFIKSLFVKNDFTNKVSFSIKGIGFFYNVLCKFISRREYPLCKWISDVYIYDWLNNYNETHDLNLIYSYGVGYNEDESNIVSVIEELYEYFLSDCLEVIENEQTASVKHDIENCLDSMSLTNFFESDEEKS